MSKQNGRKNTIMFPLLLLLITVILTVFGSALFIDPATSVSRLDKGWSVTYGDLTYSDVSLSELTFDNLKKGDLITISNTIPARDIYSPTLMFKSISATVDVMVDGTYIYSFGHLYDDMKKMVPKKLHLIALDDMTSAHSLTIMLKITDNNASRYLNPIYTGNRRELIRNILQQQRLSVFIGGFLMMYACLQISLEIYLFLTRQKNNTMLYGAFISLTFGFYTYACRDIFSITTDNDYFFSMVEYISLYLLPLSISLLFHSTHPKVAFFQQRIILIVNIIAPIVYCILHAANIVHLNAFINHIKIICLVETIVITPPLVANTLKTHREKVKSETYTDVDADYYLLIGFVILIFFALVEIAKSTLDRLHPYSINFFSNTSFLTIGALYFVVCLFIYYFFHGIDHMNTQFLKEHLEGLAYTDSLTGLMNRAKCMQSLASLSAPYAIVSLDMDRLKYINDNYGHNEGDKMIKTFADLLTKAFDKASIVGRTGGDEFLVAIENPSATICDESIQTLNRLMSDFNKSSSEKFTLSASAGYAYSYEDKDGKLENVFYLADARMYKIKEAHHD